MKRGGGMWWFPDTEEREWVGDINAIKRFKIIELVDLVRFGYFTFQVVSKVFLGSYIS